MLLSQDLTGPSIETTSEAVLAFSQGFAGGFWLLVAMASNPIAMASTVRSSLLLVALVSSHVLHLEGALGGSTRHLRVSNLR